MNTRVDCLRKSNCRSGEQTFDGCFRRVNGVRHCLSNLSDKYVLTFLRFDQNGTQMVKSTGCRIYSSPRAELYQIEEFFPSIGHASNSAKKIRSGCPDEQDFDLRHVEDLYDAILLDAHTVFFLEPPPDELLSFAFPRTPQEE